MPWMDGITGRYTIPGCFSCSHPLSVCGEQVLQFTLTWRPKPCFNIKILSYQYWKSDCGYKTVARSSCLVHPGVRDKWRVSEIDLSQPRNETAFWWRHNGPVTSQSTDPIKWPNHPLELIEIYVYINIHNKESLTQRCRRSTNIQLCLIFLYISILVPEPRQVYLYCGVRKVWGLILL